MKKKMLVLCLSLILVFMCMSPSFGADCVQGGTYTVSIPFNAGVCSSGAVSLSYSNCSFISGEWSASNIKMTDVNGSEGVFGCDGVQNISGKLNITVQAGSNIGNASVSAEFTWKNGSTSISGGSKEVTFSVGCANHNYKESRTEATCTKDGLVVKTCTVCNEQITEKIPKLGHSLSNVKITKEATCTEAGSKEGVCTRCGETVKETIPAKGHKPGEYVPMYEGDCQHYAIEQAVCSVCGETVVKETNLGGHKFENPVLVQAASLTKPEIYEGTCTVCGQTTKQVGLCMAKDESTGLIFRCVEGVFPEGTSLKNGIAEEDNEKYILASLSLDGVSTTFTLFDINALLGEAKVEPNGEVEVVFPIPEEYGKNVGLYYIGEDGSLESIGGKISADGSTFTANIKHFSSYALCVLNGAMPIEEETNNTLLYVVIALAVLNIVQLILYLNKGKRKKELVVANEEMPKANSKEAFKGVKEKIEEQAKEDKVIEEPKTLEKTVVEEVKETKTTKKPKAKKEAVAKKEVEDTKTTKKPRAPKKTTAEKEVKEPKEAKAPRKTKKAAETKEE